MTSIKTKLSRGFGFLFLNVLALAVLGIYFIRRVSEDAKVVLKDNYETLQYSQQMLRSLHTGLDDSVSVRRFERFLSLQEQNITEPGEATLTASLRQTYQNGLVQNLQNAPSTVNKLSSLIVQINEINLKAIRRKANINAEHTQEGILILSLLGTISILITLSFSINFPGYIANPLRQLTASIEEITKKNYEARLLFDSNDELGQLASSFNRMAEKLDEYEHSNLAQLISEKSRLEALIDHMQDAVIGFDWQQNILFANDNALSMLNIPKSQLIGRYAPDVALHNDLLRTLLQTPRFEKELNIVAEGREQFFEVEKISVQTSSESVIGQMIVLKNVTSFHELNEAKTNFIATISHELKTPLSSINLSLKLLDDKRLGSLNEEQQSFVKHIREDTERLLNITSELLQASQVETGKIQLNVAPTAVQDIVQEATEFVRTQAEQKQISIQIQAMSPQLRVMADLEKTTWVLVNFLSNALRHSPAQSSIQIVVSEANRSVKIEVIDEGIGLEESHLKRVFDRYFQVPTHHKDTRGSGLGLSIAREFIIAQQGNIWASSRGLGMGTTFGFELPTAS